MEYSKGVTLLLFSATNTIVKSWVTRACSIATVATTAPANMTGANKRPSSARRAPRFPSARRATRHAHGAPGHDDHHRTDDASGEGQPDPEGAERRAQHKTTFPLFDFTRLGLAAQVVLRVLDQELMRHEGQGVRCGEVPGPHHGDTA